VGSKGRQIIETEDFASAVAKLGGHLAIDEALSTIMDGLYRNPFGFEHFETPPFSFRYARTKKIGLLPALVFIFYIDEGGTVYLDHVEEDRS
jgi:hypothetical protein